MGLNARACLFYGVVITDNAAKKLVKKLVNQYALDFDNNEIEEEPFECLEALGEQLKFKVAILCREDEESEDRVMGICSFEKTVYDWQGIPIVKIPDQDKLDAKWEKVQKTTGLKKKPKLHLFTDWS